MNQPPVMCSLTPDAIEARKAGLLSQLVRRADAHEELPEGHRLRFPATGETISLVARTVDAERRCCRFLRFAMVVEPDGGPVVLDLTGPPGTREFVAALLEA